jgi:hypothetical protein
VLGACAPVEPCACPAANRRIEGEGRRSSSSAHRRRVHFSRHASPRRGSAGSRACPRRSSGAHASTAQQRSQDPLRHAGSLRGQRRLSRAHDSTSQLRTLVPAMRALLPRQSSRSAAGRRHGAPIIKQPTRLPLQISAVCALSHARLTGAAQATHSRGGRRRARTVAQLHPPSLKQQRPRLNAATSGISLRGCARVADTRAVTQQRSLERSRRPQPQPALSFLCSSPFLRALGTPRVAAPQGPISEIEGRLRRHRHLLLCERNEGTLKF